MSAVLKKIERKVGNIQSEEKSLTAAELMSDIRSGIADLQNMAKSDASHEERVSSIESLVLKLCDVISKSEEARAAETKQLLAMKDMECARLEAELAHSEQECEQLESELSVVNSARLDDARIIGDLRTSLAISDTMREAETKARIVAETTLSRSNMEHEMHMKMMEKQSPEIPDPLVGWTLKPIRDGADKLLRMDLVPMGANNDHP